MNDPSNMPNAQASWSLRRKPEESYRDFVYLGEKNVTLLPRLDVNLPIVSSRKRMLIRRAVDERFNRLRIEVVEQCQAWSESESSVSWAFAKHQKHFYWYRLVVGIFRSLRTAVFLTFLITFSYVALSYYSRLKVFDGPRGVGVSESAAAACALVAVAGVFAYISPSLRLPLPVQWTAISAFLAALLYTAPYLPPVRSQPGDSIAYGNIVPETAALIAVLGAIILVAWSLSFLVPSIASVGGIPQVPGTALDEIMFALMALSEPAPLRSLHQKQVVIRSLREAAFWAIRDPVVIARAGGSRLREKAKQRLSGLATALEDISEKVLFTDAGGEVAIRAQLLDIYCALLMGKLGELPGGAVSVKGKGAGLRVLVAALPLGLFIPVAFLQVGAPPLLIGAFLVGSFVWLLGGIAPLVDPDSRSTIAALRQIFTSSKADDPSGGK